MIFEWDEEKDRQNIRKHGMNFDYASHVFADPYRIILFDSVHSTHFEDRWQTIGLVGTNIVFVVYATYANEKTIRLISARKANVREKRQYGQNRV